MLFFHAAVLRAVEAKCKPYLRYLPVACALACTPYALTYASQYIDFFSHPRPARYLSLARFAKEKVPPLPAVGAFQSGCLSYFLDNRVINLDGVINENAHFHLIDKSLDSYLREQNIEYIVEEEFLFRMWDDYLDGQISNNYALVQQTKQKRLPSLWSTINIYKRKSSASAAGHSTPDT
jgi:hypothetical protein